jgi:hypothetical protein
VNITTCKNASVEFQYETLEEMYLGESASRFDESKKGVEVKLSFHHDDPEVLKLVQAFDDRATRRTPGLRIDVLMTLAFPNGKRPKISIPDVFTGNVPFVAGGKNTYVQSDFTLKASNHRFLNLG